MNQKIFTVAACALMLAATQTAQAQNLMENATISPLGEAKTWTGATGTYTFDTEALELALNPENGQNIFLFPEAQNGGGYNTEANREIGIQGFYVDLGTSQKIGTINTTWEGAAADAYSIFLTDTEPTLAILETTPTYTATGLGQYTQNVAILPDKAAGRYVVFQPTNATNYGWGVKIRSIAAYAPQDDELTFFSVEPAFVFDDAEPISFTFRNQIGLPISVDKVTVTCDHGTFNLGDFTDEGGKTWNGTLTLTEGETATFTASIDGNDELTFTVSHPNAPKAPEQMLLGIYTQKTPDVLWQFGYNAPGDEEATKKVGTHEFVNGELTTIFHAAYCIFFYNDQTMAGKGAWNTITVTDPAEELGKYLNLAVYSSRPSHCYISFNDNVNDSNWETASKFQFALPHDDWSYLSVDMSEVEADQMKNMSIRFPEQHDLDCVMLSNIYFSGTPTGSEVITLTQGTEVVNVYSASGMLLKRGVKAIDALEGLGNGLYIVGGKKVVK